jgi:hypothetical protein
MGNGLFEEGKRGRGKGERGWNHLKSVKLFENISTFPLYPLPFSPLQKALCPMPDAPLPIPHAHLYVYFFVRPMPLHAISK